MNKLYSKIAALSVGLAMAVGVGVAVGTKEAVKADAAKGDEKTVNVDLSTGDGDQKDDSNNVKIVWSIASGKITIEQLRSCASSASSGEQTFTAVSNSYISAPRAYRGHTFAFTGIDDFTIKSVKFTYTGSYGGLGFVCGSTTQSANLTAPKSSKATAVTGGVGVVSDTTNFTATQDTSKKTWTIVCNIAAGTDTLYVQNYDNNESTATTQLRPTAIEVTYIVGDEAKEADEVNVSGNASMSVGGVQSFTATCLNEGSSTGVDQTVTWSVSDETVLSVSSTGVVTALSAGEANVIATAANNVAGSLKVTVSASSNSLAPKTFSPSTLGMSGTAYAANNGFHGYRDFVVQSNAVAVASSDYVKDNVVLAYQKDGFIFQKSNGVIKTKTLLSAKINAVSISGSSTTAPAVTIKGGNALDGTDVSSNDAVSTGMIHRYVFSTPVNYVTISINSTASGAIYFNSFTLEFVGGSETADSLADYILGLIPDRTDETGLCKGESGNYMTAKGRLAAADPAVISEFETSEDATIVSARARYEAWARAYGDATPYSKEVTPMARYNEVLSTDNNSTMIIVITIAAVSALAFTTLLVFKKKKQK